MNFPISSFSFVSFFFFISFKAILLGIYTLLLFSDGYLRNYNMHPDLPKSAITWYLYLLLRKCRNSGTLKQSLSILFILLDYIATVVVYFNLDVLYPTSHLLLFSLLFTSSHIFLPSILRSVFLCLMSTLQCFLQSEFTAISFLFT